MSTERSPVAWSLAVVATPIGGAVIASLWTSRRRGGAEAAVDARD